MQAPEAPPQPPRAVRLAHAAMALCLAVMATSVFVNVVLRYGFGSGVAASEELSRLLFVWMVFIGATASYPMGEHMAFTGLLQALREKPAALVAMAALIRTLVVLGCSFLAWGAWQQIVVGMGSHSVVLGYSSALLPLPAFLCSLSIALMALVELVRNKALSLGHSAEVE
ncbi:MAG: TRAP transporter small permease subunit [Rhodoferax sp.]|uniref:TRAP transporter small permease subunit n=1 Tax=Rhodoferax sp. TaxID=50421 RepID=UPI003267D7F7